MIYQNNNSLAHGLSQNNQIYPVSNQQVSKQNLTTLPTVIWSLAASFLSFPDLRNLTLTNRVFVEAASKQSEDLKIIIAMCIKDSSLRYYYTNHTLLNSPSKSTSFSLPILLQLRSLKAISPNMIKIYQKSIASVSKPLGKDVLLKCESLECINVSNNSDTIFLEAFDKEVCPKLSFLDVGVVDLGYMNDFFNVNGNKLIKISAPYRVKRSREFRFNTIHNNCPNLTDLSISSDYLYNGDFSYLSSFPNLTILNITGLATHLHCVNLIPLITSRQMVVLNHSLQLSQIFIDVLADNADKITRLEMPQYGVGSNPNLTLLKLLENLKNVCNLNLKNCNISDVELEAIANNCSKLEFLDLRDNNISIEGISKLLLCFPNLISLHLSNCYKFKDSIDSLRKSAPKYCKISFS